MVNGPLFSPVFDDDGHLAAARGGGFLGAVLNNENNKLQGQARWLPVESPEQWYSDPVRMSDNSSPSQGMSRTNVVIIVAAAIAVAVVTTVIIVKASPRIKAWWDEAARPRIVKLWQVINSKNPFKFTKAQVTAEMPINAEALASQVELVLSDEHTLMTSSEAQRRYLALVLAMGFVAEQVRMLKGARIADILMFEELEKTAQTLTSPYAVSALNKILESADSGIDESVKGMIYEMFGGGIRRDSTYLPITLKSVGRTVQLEEMRGNLAPLT